MDETLLPSAAHINEELREEYLELKKRAAFGAKDPNVYLKLGDICHFSGAGDEARRWYKTAALVSKNDPGVLEHINMHIPMDLTEKRPFFLDWDKVLKYPLRGTGWLALLTAAFGLVLSWFAVSFAGFFGFAFTLLVYMFLFAHILRVVEHTANGDDEIPRLFGEAFDFASDVFMPVLSLTLAVFWYFALPFILFLLGRKVGLPMSPAAVAKFTTVYFSVIFPAVLGAVAMGGFFTALNPVVIFKAIRLTFLHYMVAVAALALINFGISSVLNSKTLASQPLLILPISALVSAYVYYLTAHIVGRIFRDNAEKLGL